jgi:hypothetical protein
MVRLVCYVVDVRVVTAENFYGQHVRIAQYALAGRVLGIVVGVDTKGWRRQSAPPNLPSIQPKSTTIYIHLNQGIIETSCQRRSQLQAPQRYPAPRLVPRYPSCLRCLRSLRQS